MGSKLTQLHSHLQRGAPLAIHRAFPPTSRLCLLPSPCLECPPLPLYGIKSHLFQEAFQDLPALPRALSTLTICLCTVKPCCCPSGLMFPLSLTQAGHTTYSSATELGHLLCRPSPQSGDEVPGFMQAP